MVFLLCLAELIFNPHQLQGGDGPSENSSSRVSKNPAEIFKQTHGVLLLPHKPVFQDIRFGQVSLELLSGYRWERTFTIPTNASFHRLETDTQTPAAAAG